MAAFADIPVPPDPERVICLDLDLDFGPYADYAARKVTAVEGDTLERIAERELGSAERWTEIAAIDDALAGKALKVGQEIWIPPARKPKLDPADHAEGDGAAGALPWWHFYAAPAGGFFGGSVSRIANGDRVPDHRFGTLVFAIRHDVVKAFEKDLSERGADAAGTVLRRWLWARKDGFAAIASRLPGRSSVPEGSSIRSRVESWRITAIDGGEIRLERTKSEDLDGSGMVVQGLPGVFGVDGLLLALACLALSGLVACARRRRRRAVFSRA